MKKFLAILLAVVLAFSTLTMVSFAEETANQPADVTDVPTDINDSMYAKWIDEHINSGIDNTEIALKATINGEEAPVNIYIKGYKMAIELSLKIGLFNSKIKMISDIKSGNSKIYYSFFPFFYMNIDSPDDYVNDFSDMLIKDYSDCVLKSVSKEQVSGVEYYVEKISDTENDTDLECYFKDGELVRLKTIDNDSNVIVAEVSCSVSDEDVGLPFYAFIDATAFLALFEPLLG